MSKENALAELAERLNAHIVPIAGSVGSAETGRGIAKDVGTAQRIIAELAKMGFDANGKPNMYDAFHCTIDCRAIAEEGAKDGK